ncbi:uncharacterized protein LOC131640400 [Vicia villosa]|uniref:uncharacterized protein LOC131640400 n=1 Tax=Vicia villosa TaxID=3911 RepID=UPI00273B6213|nr:uncharacterized protein LOC131640400 [Vicia villosa]
MASMLSFLNSLSHRKKPSNNTIKDDHINDDDLAIVKAAAWAWYQHGSGSCHEGEAISSEFFVRRNRREPRPSRYKLEIEAKRSMEKEIKECSSSPIHHKKEESLLDEYEVQSISRHLNKLIVSNNNQNRKKLVSSTDNIAITSVDDDVVRKNKKKIIRKGFFFKHGVVCGREGDVVDSSSVVSRDHRPLTKRVPSVNGFK